MPFGQESITVLEKKNPEDGIFNLEKMGKQQPTAKNGFSFQKSIARERERER